MTIGKDREKKITEEEHIYAEPSGEEDLEAPRKWCCSGSLTEFLIRGVFQVKGTTEAKARM